MASPLVGALLGVGVGALAARLGLALARAMRDPSSPVVAAPTRERGAVAAACVGAGAWGAALAALDAAHAASRAGLAVLGACLVVHAVTDALVHRVVRAASHAALAAGIVAGGAAALDGEPAIAARGAVGAALALVLALATARLSRGGLAAGDVRLLPAVAWHLAALDAAAPVVALAGAAVVGALHAGWLVVVRGAGRRARLAFAPSIAAGALASLVALAAGGPGS